MIRASQNYSRRRFLQSGTAGVTATILEASTAGGAAAQAGVQSPPPASTAPRVLRKPPLDELQRIARSYDLDLTREDLASFRGLMDGVLESYRRLDQFAEPTLPVKYRASRAGAPRRPRTNSTPGTGSAQSKARPRDRWQARRSLSRTTCAWPGCR
jgi:amidase